MTNCITNYTRYINHQSIRGSLVLRAFIWISVKISILVVTSSTPPLRTQQTPLQGSWGSEAAPPVRSEALLALQALRLTSIWVKAPNLTQRNIVLDLPSWDTPALVWARIPLATRDAEMPLSENRLKLAVFDGTFDAGVHGAAVVLGPAWRASPTATSVVDQAVVCLWG